MISCTEFIPAYSELFDFLDKGYGRDEVDEFWKYLFTPDGKGIPLINHLKENGIRGCYTYWAGSLNEEAADFTMYLNEKRGYFVLDMHRCPSKGRLLELADETGITPYHDYCLHCNSYRLAVEKMGYTYIYDFKGIDRASCSILIYDPEVFDGRVIVDDDTEIMDRKASDNEYFHKDFHKSMNMGIDYLGNNYGINAVKSYLYEYTNNVYKKVIDDIKIRGLVALKEKIYDTYFNEKAIDVIDLSLGEDYLIAEIKYCPAVEHIKSCGQEVSKWYKYTTEFVMEALAEKTGLNFEMLYYDENTGASKYVFTNNKM